jgi:signal peptidase I
MMENKVATKEKEGVLDWIKFIVKLVVICVLVNSSVGITRVIGHSMDPTLKNGSLLLVNKFSTYFGQPDHGDVVIIDDGMGYDIIKRVIGLPGDKVSIKDGTVYVNESPLPEISVLGISDDMSEVVVEKDHLFIMGDNRAPGESLDSRSDDVGIVDISGIKEYALISLLPMYKIAKPLEI